MFSTLREAGPGFLVPAAWLVVAAVELGVAGSQSIFVAHLVMATFIAFFLATGWSEMDDGALAGWRAVMVVGLGITLLGIAGFLFPEGPTLLATSLVGWMVLPAVGLAYTGRLLSEAQWIYYGSAILSALGALVFVGSLLGVAGGGLIGILLVGVGQAIGIIDAVVRF